MYALAHIHKERKRRRRQRQRRLTVVIVDVRHYASFHSVFFRKDFVSVIGSRKETSLSSSFSLSLSLRSFFFFFRCHFFLAFSSSSSSSSSRFLHRSIPSRLYLWSAEKTSSFFIWEKESERGGTQQRLKLSTSSRQSKDEHMPSN